MDRRIVNYYLLNSVLDRGNLPTLNNDKKIFRVRGVTPTEISLIKIENGYHIRETVIGARENTVTIYDGTQQDTCEETVGGFRGTEESL